MGPFFESAAPSVTRRRATLTRRLPRRWREQRTSRQSTGQCQSKRFLDVAKLAVVAYCDRAWVSGAGRGQRGQRGASCAFPDCDSLLSAEQCGSARASLDSTPSPTSSTGVTSSSSSAPARSYTPPQALLLRCRRRAGRRPCSMWKKQTTVQNGTLRAAWRIRSHGLLDSTRVAEQHP